MDRREWLLAILCGSVAALSYNIGLPQDLSIKSERPMNLRTDTEAVQLPNPLPNVGGLYGINTVVEEEAFPGVRCLRVTDGSLLPDKGTMQTASWGGAKLWSLDESMFLLSTTDGGQRIFSFDEKNFKVEMISTTVYQKAFFSSHTPKVMYTLDHTKLTKITFSSAFVPSSPTLVCDFSNILPQGFDVKWNGILYMSEKDSHFSVGFSEGDQDTAFHVCCFKQGSGYRMLDTHTGEVTGDWGDKGKAVITSKSGLQFPFDLHEVVQTPNPEYTLVSPITKYNSNTLVWKTSGLQFVELGHDGHSAKGWNHVFALSKDGQLTGYEYANPNGAGVDVLPDSYLPVPKLDYGGHPSFGRMLFSDNGWIWDSGYHNDGLILGQPFASAWESEVLVYDLVLKKVGRAFHNFNSQTSPWFDTAKAVGVPGPSNQRILIATDFMGTLGLDVNNKPRGDVFLIDISKAKA